MYDLTKNPAQLKAQISRYEKMLRQEKKTLGMLDDSAGNRYLLGPMYLASDDLQGALKSYKWFEKSCPDDEGEPFQYLCWTLVLYRTGNIKLASEKLVKTMLMNLYLFPHLFKIEVAHIDIWYGSSEGAEGYIGYAPKGVFELWQESEIAWAKEIYYQPDVTKIRDRYIEIFHQLKNEPVGPKRSELVNEALQLSNFQITDVFAEVSPIKTTDLNTRPEAMVKIFTVDILCNGNAISLLRYECRRIIEMRENQTFADLHLAIQQFFNFANDHMYAFFLGELWKGHSIGISGDNTEQAKTTNLGKWLKKDKIIGYIFDFGDEWVFGMAVTDIREEPRTDKQYPVLIEKIGRNPKQYRKDS